MEHLENPYSVLIKLVELLKTRGEYRFFCPNYNFPYEPHFGKWLFLRKDKVFYLQKSGANSSSISSDEASGLLSSLNYITLRHLKNSVKGTEIKLKPNQSALCEILSRSCYDFELSKRHPRISKIARFLCSLKLHYLAKLVPTNFSPIMDVKAVFSRT